MAGQSANGASEKQSFIAKYLVAVIMVVLLSLATWSFFWVRQMPLTPADTGVVVGFWLLVVFVFRWIFGRKSRGQDKATTAKSN